MMHKKVGVVTSAHPPFDPRILLKECKSLAEAGYEVTLIVPHERDEQWDGVQIRAVPRLKGRLHRFTLTLWHLYREALRLRADFYHVHDPELLVVGALLKITTRAQIIFDAHEDYPSVVLKRAWIPKPLRRVLSTTSKLVIRFSLPFFDAVVAATEQIAEELPHPNKVVVKNYSKVVPGSFGDGHESNLLVYAGTICEERGLSLFLEAFRRMQDVMPVRLRLVGVRDNRDMISQILRSCPPGSVEVFGWMPQPEALRLIATGTLGLLLDLFYPGTDGPPTKLFEYMALGLPVVGSDLPITQTILEQTGCGIAVDFHEPAEIAAKVVELLRDSDRLADMRRRGFEACKNYLWGSQAELLVALYRNLESASAGKPRQQAREFRPHQGPERTNTSPH